MSFNRQVFLDGIRSLFGGSLKQSQVDGLNAILDEWERRKPNGDLRWLAYMLATAFHETNQQMQPVREAYWLSENWRKTHLSYYPYYGRGYVQLTHKGNYARAGTAVGQNLVDNPDLALQDDVAAYVMFVGMEEGWFRSSSDGMPFKLARFFNGTLDDPEGARKIINGKETKVVGGVVVTVASIIAQYHRRFLEDLTSAQSAAVGTSVAAESSPSSAGFTSTSSAAGGYAQQMVQVATGQWEFFGRQTYDLNGHKDHAGHTEAEEGWWQRVGEYWLEGTNTHGIDGRDTDWPWSAAFVSWVAKRAGAGTRFRYSTQHSVYIAQSIRDYLAKRADAGFWGVRLNEDKPAVGDIVCWGRQAGVDYDHQMNGDYKGHSDHVVAVEPTRIWIIGGNVGDSVTRRPVALNAQGFLAPVTVNGENLFALMKNRLG